MNASEPTADFSARAAAWVLACLLLARLALGFAYSVFNPLGEAPDEADHYAYAAFIARERRLPTGTMMTQAKHPPLYYLLVAGLTQTLGVDADSGFLRSNPDAGVGSDAAAPNFFIHTGLERWPWRGGALAMRLARLVSVLAGAILVAATYALGRAVWPGWYAGPLAAAAFVACLPEALFIGGSVSNDILAAMWATLALWLGLRSQRLWAAAGAGLCLGLAVLTKASTATLAPVVAAAVLLATGYSFSRRLLGVAVGRVSITATLTLLTVAPWLWRNWQLWGDPLGWPLVLATIDRRPGPLALGDLVWLARGWFLSFWGKTGAAGHLPLPAPFYVAWGALLIAAVLGWLRLSVGAGRPRTGCRDLQSPGHQHPAPSAAGWVVLLGAPAMTILGIVSYSRVALGTDQGRLLFPSLAPIALLVVGGLAAWLPAPRARWLAGGMIGGMGVVAVLALGAGILRPFMPPAAPPPAEVAQTTPAGAKFGDALELVAFRWGDEPATAGEIPLTLYWRASRPVNADLRAVLRLTDGAGNLLWEAKRSPGAGRYSTDRWPAGRLVRDVYTMPAGMLYAATAVALGVQLFPDGAWLSLADRPNMPFFPLSVPRGKP